ncbi:serine/threonine-protein kinase [Streptomyces sp. NPDC004111]|uniref:serine/threonine-protein kinase n=1 Tax=Streptomyces sp. NPDC004111 TaxID=3364690 RepID=UPI00368AB062
MTNDGGRAYEPTSYGLQPPHAPQHPHPSRAPGEEPTQAHPPPHATQPADPAAGRVIGGRYRLVSRLGHGGMGTVWRAHDETVDRDVAVKEPRVPDHLPERERQNVYLRMQREARAAARITHPSVVTMHDVVVEDGKPWIVMELVPGHSLGDRLQEGTLDVRDAARIGLAVLGALEAAHRAGVLHRDVKPDNVLLGENDRVVLSDFGIAQVEGEQGLTETGGFVGSPEFIAPERVLGQRPGPASDLWSLGVVLYAAVEGMSPYRRSNTPATLQAVLSAEPQNPARGNGPFGELVMRLLHKDPAARPDAATVRAELEKATGRTPPRPVAHTRPASQGTVSDWLPPVVQRTGKKTRYGILAGVLVVALALVLLLLNPFAGDAPPENWKLHRALQSVTADIYLPDDYKSYDDSADNTESFYEPGNVFQVYVVRVAVDKDNQPPLKSGREAYYTAGGKDKLEMKDAKTTVTDSTQQDKPAFDAVVDYTNYADSGDDPVRKRRHERVVVGGAKKAYWRIEVTMPAEGKFRAEGEQLFQDITKHLKILDL